MRTVHLNLLVLLSLLGLVFCGPRDQIAGGQHVETYWESWSQMNTDFSSRIQDIPVTPLGSDNGVNVVNIAFASNALNDRWCNTAQNCITSGLSMNATQLTMDVDFIHSAGGLVKLAVGGEVYGNLGSNTYHDYTVVNLASRLANVVHKYNLDGVDLTQQQACGNWDEALCNLAFHLELLEKLRALLPDKIISYTFPRAGDRDGLEPFRSVAMYGHQYVDYFNVFGAKNSGQINSVVSLGVPIGKVVWGLNIGCNSEYWGDVMIEDAMDAAVLAKQYKLGGVMTWSINKDTNKRMDNWDGACNEFQTGMEDASFVNAISSIINGE